MCTACDKLFVVFVQDCHVDSIFRTETMMVQSRLCPDPVEEPLLHLTEERARVTARVRPVNVWVFGGIPFPRGGWDDAEVAQGRHCRTLTMLHLDFFLISAEAAAHARATSILSCLCPISSPWSSSQVRS